MPDAILVARVRAALDAIEANEPHAVDCEVLRRDTTMDTWSCTCDIDERIAEARALAVTLSWDAAATSGGWPGWHELALAALRGPTERTGA